MTTLATPATASSTTAASSTAPSSTRRRTVVLWAAQVFFAVFFLVAAAGPKLFGEKTAVHIFDETMGAPWLRYVVGALELAAVVGLLVPRLAGLTCVGLCALMVGATLTQIFILDAPAAGIFPFVLGVVFALIARARRAEIRDLVTLVRR